MRKNVEKNSRVRTRDVQHSRRLALIAFHSYELYNGLHEILNNDFS